MSEVQGTRTPVLETRGITKVFPGVVANSNKSWGCWGKMGPANRP